MDLAAILDLLKRAADERQIKISLHAAEEAIAEEITRREIEAAISGLPVTIITVYEPHPPKWITPTQRGGSR